MSLSNKSKEELIKCISNMLKKESIYLKQKALELKTNGVVVIDLHLFKEHHDFLHKTNWIEEIKNIQLRDFNTKDPMYGFVLGAFGAFGNPASFHNELLYKLRYILFMKLKSIFKNIDSKRYLECLFDRVCIRRKDTTTTGETFHRDTCSLKEDQDFIYGGWINLDKNITQYFSCVPGTHMCSGKGGFEKIASQDFKKQKVKIQIKPKQVIIFNQNIIHEIFPQKQKNNSVRLYLGWRHTLSDKPLFNSDTNPRFNINNIISEQIVPPLPSGDFPKMYSKNHPRFYKNQLIQITKEIKDFYTEYNDKYPNNRKIKQELDYPIEVYKIHDFYKTIYYPNKL